MGATSAMYGGAWMQLPEALYHDWPKDDACSTITALAQRVIERNKIKNGDVIIGSSLGGIVGCEVANLLKLNQLILIGSAINSREIASLLRLLHPLIDYAPMEFIRHASGKIPHELSSMFADSDPGFIRSMCRAIFSWGGYRRDPLPMRIHGLNDRVIPIPQEVNLALDGGHLIAMTHAAECVDFIREQL